MAKKFLTFLLLIFNFFAKAQTNLDDKRLQISVITCSPGNELYSIFGHTAIRVVDSTQGSDYFFNYGTFDFEDPNFLAKFVRGKLDYYLNIDDGKLFFEAYKQEARTITEQILQLTPIQKIAIYKDLLVNFEPKNKYYKYDFLFDNCTTRARDILLKNTALKNNFQLVNTGTTFRQMLYQYLDSSNMCWSKLGIDILLGSKIDKPVTASQSTFLPDYFMLSIDSNHKHINAIEEVKVYNKQPLTHPSFTNYYPILIFTFLALLIVVAFVNNWDKLMYYYAAFFMIITGLIGVLLIFMWCATDHKSCGNNYNLLWALPSNILGIFLIHKQNKIAQVYFKATTLLTVVLVLCWFMLPQHFNMALLPIAIANVFAYKFLWQKTTNNNIAAV
jgi:hypothetical protein